MALNMGKNECFGLLLKPSASSPLYIHQEVEIESPGPSPQKMASLRDQGIDPACHAKAQWFGDTPSSTDFLIHLSKRIVTLMNNVSLPFSIQALV